jgi:4-hydroxy-4-methyl-2-oxoglutarate aldolase
MAHAAMAAVQPGEVLVITMPEAEPVALVGELLATQALAQGAAAMLIDAAVRDAEELRTLGLPVWARFIRVRGATRTAVGEINTPVVMGGATIHPGDIIVLDGDGAVVVAAERAAEVLAASQAREAREASNRTKFQAGQLSIDLYNLRQQVAGQLPPGRAE